MTMTFSNWTEYDDWLIQNYEKYGITSVNEGGGSVKIEYIDKAEWDALSKKNESVSGKAN